MRGRPIRRGVAWLGAALWLAAATLPAVAQTDGAAGEEGDAAGAAPHWLGVQVSPAGDALASQLRLPKGQGLTVDDVVAGSPAESGGVRKHDVLLSADRKPFGTPEDLQRILAESKGQPVALELVRGGERQTLPLTPQPAPQGAAVLSAWKGVGIDPVRPGAELPDDVELTVRKRGPAPARITVVRGEKTWHLTEQTLDQLPEELRGPVSRYGGIPQPTAAWDIVTGDLLRVFVFPQSEPSEPSEPSYRLRLRNPARDAGAGRRGPDEADRPLEQRLDDIVRRLEALEKSSRQD